MKKLINFKRMQLVRDIQDYANEHFEGNFTLAVVSLCKLGINSSKKAQ